MNDTEKRNYILSLSATERLKLAHRQEAEDSDQKPVTKLRVDLSKLSAKDRLRVVDAVGEANLPKLTQKDLDELLVKLRILQAA